MTARHEVRSPHPAHRRVAAACAVLAVLVAAACAPPPAPAPPPSTAPPTTAAAPSPTCAVATSSGRSTSLGVEARTPDTLSGTAEITAAAAGAAAEAARFGADEVTVVAVDDDGRPSIVGAPIDEAVDVALATAASLDVVAVEASAPFEALEDAGTASAQRVSADPLVDKQWAFASFPFAALWPCGRGAGVTVAVVDSGVAATHPDFGGGRVTPGVAFLDGNPAEPGGGTTDENGHGTHVAGIIAAGENGIGVVGVAPEVTIVPVRVLDQQGMGASSDIGRGITWAVDEGVDVINTSLGSNTDTAAVSTAVAYAISHGIPVVSAGGNGGVNGSPRYPAALPDVIAVAALNENGNIADYSTRGSYIDVAAPGTDIMSTVPEATWTKISGTSMSTPHVSAVVALIVGARGNLAPSAMITRLTSTASDAGPSGFDDAYGWGRINPVAAFNAP